MTWPTSDASVYDTEVPAGSGSGALQGIDRGNLRGSLSKTFRKLFRKPLRKSLRKLGAMGFLPCSCCCHTMPVSSYRGSLGADELSRPQAMPEADGFPSVARISRPGVQGPLVFINELSASQTPRHCGGKLIAPRFRPASSPPEPATPRRPQGVIPGTPWQRLPRKGPRHRVR